MNEQRKGYENQIKRHIVDLDSSSYSISTVAALLVQQIAVACTFDVGGLLLHLLLILRRNLSQKRGSERFPSLSYSQK